MVCAAFSLNIGGEYDRIDSLWPVHLALSKKGLCAGGLGQKTAGPSVQ